MTSNLQTTIEATNATWLAIARPIVKAMHAVEDAIHPVTTARLADPLGHVSWYRRSAESNAWSEAQNIVSSTANSLHDMLDGIRENALCDAYVHVDYGGTEAEIDAEEQFNDDLRDGVISVDAAVRMIGEEQ